MLNDTRTMLSDDQFAQALHVVVGIIRIHGQFLLAKRPEGTRHADLWEFPGGKVEPGESSFQALSRELHEELGIRILADDAHHFVNLWHHYESDRPSMVLLDCWLLDSFEGRPELNAQAVSHQAGVCPEDLKRVEMRGAEGQLLRYSNLQNLNELEFPAANKKIIAALGLPEHYIIHQASGRAPGEPESIAEFDAFAARSASMSGMLRWRQSPSGSPFDLDQLLFFAGRVNARDSTVVFDFPEHLLSEIQTKKPDLSGLSFHLKSASLASLNAEALQCLKRACGVRAFIGSCHNYTEVEQANRLRLDAITLSPVKETASHPAARPLGWTKLRQLAQSASMPVYALGGMTLEDLGQAKHNGAFGISGIRTFEKRQF